MEAAFLYCIPGRRVPAVEARALGLGDDGTLDCAVVVDSVVPIAGMKADRTKDASKAVTAKGDASPA